MSLVGFSKSPLFKSISSLFSIQVLNYALPLIVLPYLVRALGVEGYGQMVFVLAVMQYGVVLVDYGFNWTAVKSIASDQNNKILVSKCFWEVICCRLLLATLVLLLLVIAWWSGILAGEASPYFAAFLMVLASALSPTFLLQGLEQLPKLALTNIVARLAVIPVIFLVVKSPSDLVLAIVLQAGSALVAVVMALVLVWRTHLLSYSRPKFRDLYNTYQHGWHLFVSTAFVNLYTTSNVVVLGLLAGDVAAGIYGAADKIRQAAQGVTTPISQALYPRINALFSLDVQAAYKLLSRAAKILILLTFLGGCFLFIFSHLVVKLLLGEAFLNASDVLKIFSFIPLVLVLSNMFGVQLMLPLGYKKHFSLVIAIAGGLSLVLIAPLCMMFGASGAALTVLLVEVFVTMSMGVVLFRKRILQKLIEAQ